MTPFLAISLTKRLAERLADHAADYGAEMAKAYQFSVSVSRALADNYKPIPGRCAVCGAYLPDHLADDEDGILLIGNCGNLAAITIEENKKKLSQVQSNFEAVAKKINQTECLMCGAPLQLYHGMNEDIIWRGVCGLEVVAKSQRHHEVMERIKQLDAARKELQKDKAVAKKIGENMMKYFEMAKKVNLKIIAMMEPSRAKDIREGAQKFDPKHRKDIRPSRKEHRGNGEAPKHVQDHRRNAYSSEEYDQSAEESVDEHSMPAKRGPTTRETWSRVEQPIPVYPKTSHGSGYNRVEQAAEQWSASARSKTKRGTGEEPEHAIPAHSMTAKHQGEYDDDVTEFGTENRARSKRNVSNPEDIEKAPVARSWTSKEQSGRLNEMVFSPVKETSAPPTYGKKRERLRQGETGDEGVYVSGKSTETRRVADEPPKLSFQRTKSVHHGKIKHAPEGFF
ncbi:hypothetical protein P154DRAFT_584281 [Amniculicola lignicola CBS 123094]|uniref:Uncharacterized protein n=1 Tax=Amniculicola lignicola CBS 123094 TaxID=1392246 RepID=A0A6A5X4V4_9PLEO|nr:hypothetical protein P154DRAFT_584281 [Amniculicola lignicola CBS 123094]